MTESEIIRNLKLGTTTVTEAIKRAAEKTPSIKKKYIDGKLWCCTQFNLEEAKAIYKELGCNELQLTLLEENWIEKPATDVYTITGTNKAIIENNLTKKCCNTCEFLIGKTSSSINLRPYCNLYKKLLDKTVVPITKNKFRKVNVYSDYCVNYSYKKQDKLRMWYKKNAPTNLNQYGRIDTTNGIEQEKLNTHRKRNEPIILVNQIGFD